MVETKKLFIKGPLSSYWPIPQKFVVPVLGLDVEYGIFNQYCIGTESEIEAYSNNYVTYCDDNWLLDWKVIPMQWILVGMELVRTV